MADRHHYVLTGSRAMHSHIIEIFNEEGAKSKKSTATNLAITLQRRYRNMLVDSTRQKQLETFLGFKLHKHFPTLPDQPLQVLFLYYMVASTLKAIVRNCCFKKEFQTMGHFFLVSLFSRNLCCWFRSRFMEISFRFFSIGVILAGVDSLICMSFEACTEHVPNPL